MLASCLGVRGSGLNVLGPIQGERETVYGAVVELVRRRLEKARSV